MHELFEAQAARTPQAIAAIAGGRSLTYANLDRRANQVAHRLEGADPSPEPVVAILIERSPELLVAMLGVMKAGAVCLPLDPRNPPERLAFLLRHSGAGVLLTRGGTLALRASELSEHLLRGGGEVEVVDVDRLGMVSDEPLGLSVAGERLACLFYTSGSTGAAKAVAVPHRGLVNYLEWCVDAYEVAGGRGAPVQSPVGFDLTVTSLYGPLVCGRAVTLLADDDPTLASLRDALAEGGFSLVKITPAHLELLSRSLDAAGVSGARRLVIGGEALNGETLDRWRHEAPGTRVVNEYGPTETVVGCCVHDVAAGDLRSGPVPIGRPIANTTLHVLDDAMRPVAAGAQGELYIGGFGVVRGYLRAPGLTAAQFLPDPFGAPGARLYRTGDLVRKSAGGVLVFLGRADSQVKVRGFRIELEEVATHLLAHEAVGAATADVRGAGALERRLVAYVVPRDGRSVAAGELREHLARRLPDYMQPAAIVVMDRFPLTPSGKVDRRRLPDPDVPPESSLRRSDSSPASGEESVDRIAAAFAEVLGREQVTPNTHFFQVGGTSLLASVLVGRLRRLLHADIPLRALFENPTAERLAAWVEERSAP